MGTVSQGIGTASEDHSHVRCFWYLRLRAFTFMHYGTGYRVAGRGSRKIDGRAGVGMIPGMYCSGTVRVHHVQYRQVYVVV